MFSGAISVNLDSKGRMAIPTRYRDDLASGMICTIGLYDPCLVIYPNSEWAVIEQQLAKLSSVIESERRIKRLILGHAVECLMDNHGRILLPSSLRLHARLNKKTMLIGQSNKLEIWDESIWCQQIEDDIASISTTVDDLSDNLKGLTI